LLHRTGVSRTAAPQPSDSQQERNPRHAARFHCRKHLTNHQKHHPPSTIIKSPPKSSIDEKEDVDLDSTFTKITSDVRPKMIPLDHDHFHPILHSDA
jgi:hypothetical protein